MTLDLAADRVTPLRGAADETERADPAPSAAAAASGRRGPRWFGFLLGAVIGGATVFAIGYALIGTGILPVPARDENGATAADPERLAAEIETLRQGLAAIPAGPDLAPIDQRLAALETAAGGVDALRAEVAALSAAAGANATRLDDIGRELAALQEAMTTAAAAGGDPDAANRIMEAIIAVEQRVGTLENAGPPAQLLTLQRRVDQLAQQVTTFAANLQAVAAETGERDRTEAAARSLAMSTLRAAAERGERFDAELAALAGLGVDEAAIAALGPLAAADVPTAAELAAGFGPVREAMLDALDTGPGAEAGFWERLLGNAAEVVTVRPTGPIEGDTPVAIVSRIEAALAAGDLATALAERAALPQPAQDASAAWAADVEQRLALEAALDRLAEAVRAAQVADGVATP
ncbi:MAG: COG4223 family protein [Bauldia sp.]